MSLREPAWRVTTRELESALEEERGEGDRAAGYLVSPYGARMNRVLLVGAISEAEPLGAAEPATFWRARLTDPLGSVAVTAGTFQPRAMAQLRAAPPARPALVVGKAHLYRGRSEVGVVSVRAEAVRPVAEADERAILAEVVRQSLDRLDLLERLEHEPGIADLALRAAGHPAVWIRAAREALRRYPDADREGYRRALEAAVRRVGGIGLVPVAPQATSLVRVRVEPTKAPAGPLTEDERIEQATFLDLVDTAAQSSTDGYADVHELLRQLAQRGLTADRAEALLGRLEEGGVLEEPVVGKLRRA